MASKVRVEVDVRALRVLRDNAEQVLRELDVPVLAAARRVLDNSAFLVPRGGAPDDPVNLADTGAVRGPVHNPGPISTTFFAVYEHPAAGAIHAGHHWGRKTRPAPDFLRRSMRGVRALARKGVAAQLMRTLTK